MLLGGPSIINSLVRYIRIYWWRNNLYWHNASETIRDFQEKHHRLLAESSLWRHRRHKEKSWKSCQINWKCITLAILLQGILMLLYWTILDWREAMAGRFLCFIRTLYFSKRQIIMKQITVSQLLDCIWFWLEGQTQWRHEYDSEIEECQELWLENWSFASACAR